MNNIKKWYTYQKERFPVVLYGVYVLAIVYFVFSFCSYFIGAESIEYMLLIPIFIVTFLQLFMVRIVDEFKDYEEDCKYRAYRPVPRGLITLKELKVAFCICAIIQIVVTMIFSINSLIYLLAVWIFFYIMSKGFFMKKIMDKHLFLEVAFDEILTVVIAIYAASFVGITKDICLLAVITYLISWIAEISRKIRSEETEEEGVKTYTRILGIPKAILLLFILQTILMILNGYILGSGYLIYILIPYLLVNISNIMFLKYKNKKTAKCVELVSYTYIMYVPIIIGIMLLK